MTEFSRFDRENQAAASVNDVNVRLEWKQQPEVRRANDLNLNRLWNCEKSLK